MLTASGRILKGGLMAPVRAMVTLAAISTLTLAAMPTRAADLDVIARRLDIARQQIQPSLGASTYQFNPQALETIPQGANAPMNQVLLQAPGVAQDSFG
jgi:hypothetical protein